MPLRRGVALTTLAPLSRADVLESYCTQRLAKAGQCLDVSINSIALLDKRGMVYAIATAERVTLQDEA